MRAVPCANHRCTGAERTADRTASGADHRASPPIGLDVDEIARRHGQSIDVSHEWPRLEPIYAGDERTHTRDRSGIPSLKNRGRELDHSQFALSDTDVVDPRSDKALSRQSTWMGTAENGHNIQVCRLDIPRDAYGASKRWSRGGDAHNPRPETLTSVDHVLGTPPGLVQVKNGDLPSVRPQRASDIAQTQRWRRIFGRTRRIGRVNRGRRRHDEQHINRFLWPHPVNQALLPQRAQECANIGLDHRQRGGITPAFPRHLANYFRDIRRTVTAFPN